MHDPKGSYYMCEIAKPSTRNDAKIRLLYASFESCHRDTEFPRLGQGILSMLRRVVVRLNYLAVGIISAETTPKLAGARGGG